MIDHQKSFEQQSKRKITFECAYLIRKNIDVAFSEQQHSCFQFSFSATVLCDIKSYFSALLRENRRIFPKLFVRYSPMTTHRNSIMRKNLRLDSFCNSEFHQRYSFLFYARLSTHFCFTRSLT